jgi:hypothetical protein
VYTFVAPGAGTLHLSVEDGPAVDVDVHLLSAPSADQCLARGGSTLSREVEALARYWIVVDTPCAAGTCSPGPFTLTFDFAPAATSGFGTIAGDVGQLAGQLSSPAPAMLLSSIDFGATEFDGSQVALLTAGAQQILAAGGQDWKAIGFDLLARAEGAAVVELGDAIDYVDLLGKRIHMVVDVAGTRAGVNVTRALTFPYGEPYPAGAAQAFLEGEIEDLLLGAANVVPADRGARQILVVLAWSAQHVDALEQAFPLIDPGTRGDVILYVASTEGADLFLYD